MTLSELLKNDYKVAAIIMAKNEGTVVKTDNANDTKEKIYSNIERTLRSLHEWNDYGTTISKTHVDTVVLFDTGSTDDTVQLVEKHCEATGLELHLKRGKFVNFSDSRNELLEFADDKADWLVLLDSNDELRNGHVLKPYVNAMMELEKSTGVRNQARYVTQEWDVLAGKFKNHRLIRTGCGWHFVGAVHEYITLPEGQEHGRMDSLVVPDLVIYQSRCADATGNTTRRWARDKRVLLEEYHRDPLNERTVFYLAQTCMQLNQNDEALVWYKRRSEMGGFYEEVYSSLWKMGKIYEDRAEAASPKKDRDANWKRACDCYWEAYCRLERVEPLLSLAIYHDSKKRYRTAMHYLDLALAIRKPTRHGLWLDENAYDYERYHWASRVAFYVGQYQKGYAILKRAIQAQGWALEADYSNAKLYEDKLKIPEKDRIKKPES